MKIFSRKLRITLFLFGLIAWSCSEIEVPITNEQTVDFGRFQGLSQVVADSTAQSEKLIIQEPELKNPSANARTLANYALQATVTAESTYSGYSVQKIRDGSRNTTVGPSYSWANNFPSGGTLPESVFMKFTSLKTLSQIDIYTSTGYVLRNYTVLFRTTTNGSWTTLFSITNNLNVMRTHTFPDIPVLEIQVRCELGPSNQSIYGRLNEVELYGPVEPTLPSFSLQNGMLVFNSIADVDQAITYLEYKYEQHTDAFLAQYPGLNDDQLADVEESTGFNDEQPFINFENQYGLNSLRAQISAAEAIWLETTAGDETAGSDPDDSYMEDDEIRTLVNSSGEIKAGSYIYHFNNDGSYYEIYDDGSGGGGGGGGGCPRCIYLFDQNRKNGDPLPKNVKFIDNGTAVVNVVASCRSYAKDKDFQPKRTGSNGDWRFKWKVVASCLPFGPFSGNCRAKAITKSYRKKYGKWQRRIASLEARVSGSIVDTDCTGGTSIDSDVVAKKRRKVKAKVPYSNGKVQKEVIFGQFNSNKVGYYEHRLTW